MLLNLDLPRNRSSPCGSPLFFIHHSPSSLSIPPKFPVLSSFYHLPLTPSSPFRKSLDPRLVLESDKASSPFALILSFRRWPSPPYQPRIDLLIPKKTKHQSACHNHSAGGGSAEQPSTAATCWCRDSGKANGAAKGELSLLEWTGCWMCAIFKACKEMVY